MFRLPLVSLAAVLLLQVQVVSQEKTGLELLMLANSSDDEEAIKHTRAYFEDPANKGALEQCQNEGLPPPLPGTGEAPRKYHLNLVKDARRSSAHQEAKKEIELAAQRLQNAADEQAERTELQKLEAAIQRLKAAAAVQPARSVVTYRWVALGPHELRSLNLDNAAANDPKRDALWKKAQLSRGQATPLLHDTFPRPLYNGALFYSRACKDRNLTSKERNKIKVEYFVLARNPEFAPSDPALTRSTVPIGNKHIEKTTFVKSLDNRPALSVQLDKEGSQLLAALTDKNVTTNIGNDEDGSFSLDELSIRRHIAIVIDGKVVIAPTLMSPLTHGRFMIAGLFTQKELEELAERLRGKK